MTFTSQKNIFGGLPKWLGQQLHSLFYVIVFIHENLPLIVFVNQLSFVFHPILLGLAPVIQDGKLDRQWAKYQPPASTLVNSNTSCTGNRKENLTQSTPRIFRNFSIGFLFLFPISLYFNPISDHSWYYFFLSFFGVSFYTWYVLFKPQLLFTDLKDLPIPRWSCVETMSRKISFWILILPTPLLFTWTIYFILWRIDYSLGSPRKASKLKRKCATDRAFGAYGFFFVLFFLFKF